MSNTPKRLNEDGNYPAGLKRPLDDRSVTTGVSGKFTQSMSSESQQPLEGGLDGRLAKVPRIETHDVDKRSPMLTMYKTPSTVDPSSDKPHSMEARQELRDSKESRDAKVDTREVKPEHKDLHTEARTEAQGDKVKDTLRNERESKVEKVSHGDYKSENKNERDGQILGSSHFNLNEAKEQHHRGKKYFEPSSNGLDASWVPKNDIQEDNRKDQPLLAREEQENAETGEAVGENKVDSKGEEKFKEKERKKKDEWKDDKHNDWGERDKSRTDRRSSFPVSGNINAERRESTREDRESDRWERERKDVKDKESMKDKEKDNNKSESANANQKDVLQSEKEIISEQETLEHRRLKEREKDAKERKSEKDVDVDRGKPGKRAGSYDKESDDGCNEGGDGSSEKDKEGFGCNVQQRKRMLRPRGMSQSSCREARFKARARENEGCQGKSDACDIVYKPGECMQELAKLQKESEASQENESNERPQNGSTLDVRIPAEYVTATNRQVRGGQLWGTDVYTDDSDLVAVLMHTGYCRPTASPPPSAIQELRVTIRVLPPQDSYTSSLRNNVRSRAWGAAIGGSYCVERCCIVKKRGGTTDLEPCLTHVSAVEPTIAPVAIERTMTTRAAASHALRQQRFVREVTVQYNLCNEPWLKYSIGMVADKGLKKAAFTSARLKKGEVLYLETHRNRFELCFNGERAMSNGSVGTSQTAELESQKLQSHNSHDKYHGDRDSVIDVFRWSRCKRPLPQYVVKSIGIPLPVKELEVLEENLNWEDIQWSSTSVWISEKEYVLARAHFMAPN